MPTRRRVGGNMPLTEQSGPPKTARNTGQVQISLDRELCKGCGLCVTFCPEGILVMGDQFNSHGYPVVEVTDAGACRGCLFCTLVCPDVVFTLTRGEDDHAGPDAGE